jgi:hypothetical protein
MNYTKITPNACEALYKRARSTPAPGTMLDA